jgi:hypothetical protein
MYTIACTKVKSVLNLDKVTKKMAMVQDFWSKDYKERPERMSIKAIEQIFEGYRLKYPNSKIEVQINPYNRHVAKVFLVDRTNIEVEQIMLIEGLTDKTEAKVCAMADKFENGRYW